MKPDLDTRGGTDGVPNNAALAPLVSRALELRDAGRADWLAAACQARPDAQAGVRAAVERADALPALIGRTSEHDPLLRQALGGRFRLVERIGVGAMGAVYLAEDLELHRRVACKLVHYGLMAPRQALDRFAREAEAMAAVQHPAVVTIYDRGRTEADQVYIVMELVDGPPLSEFLNAASPHSESLRGDDGSWIRADLGIATRETSYVRTVVSWIADLALGLEAVHAAGVLHRDIKPSNILVRRDGRPVLLDFGIALLDEQGSGTRTPTSVGTPAYMAPESLRRDVQRTPASDVYGLAATLYHLLTLRAPYEGTPTQILAALATRDPIPAAQRRPGLPRDLQAVLDRGMHRNPARRYPTAAAFQADLRAFLEFRPVAARAVSPIERGLRRLVRSRAALGALAALAAFGIALGASAWLEHALDARRTRYAELARHFPPNFTVVGSQNREVRDDDDRAALGALLDDAADAALEPLPTLLLRASFREDHGDPEGAARDMRAVAEYVDTEFSREVAARYAAADREKRGVAALDLERLPVASSPIDHYLLGYHLLRNQRESDALEQLGDPEVRRIPHAEELYLAFTSFGRLSHAERHRLAAERFEDVVRLESRIGGRTAATAHIAGRMLAILDRHEEALRSCTEGIELAPRSHVLRLNAGFTALVLGRTQLAREHLGIARELKPQYAHIVENLVWVDVAERHFDDAIELVRSAESALRPANPGFADYWSGVIGAYAALDAARAGDKEQCTRWLEQARSNFARVPDRVVHQDGRLPDTAYRVASALEQDDEQALLLALLDLVSEAPQDWWRLQMLRGHVPDELGPGVTDALEDLLEAIDTHQLTGSSK